MSTPLTRRSMFGLAAALACPLCARAFARRRAALELRKGDRTRALGRSGSRFPHLRDRNATIANRHSWRGQSHIEACRY